MSGQGKHSVPSVVLCDENGAAYNAANPLPTGATVAGSDIQIGAVELKNAADDTRAVVSTTAPIEAAGGLAVRLAGPAHDSVLSGSPVRGGSHAVSTLPAAVATGDVVNDIATLEGAKVVRPYSIPAAEWAYAAAATGITNSNVAVTIKAAGAAGIRNYITGLQLAHDALGAATEIAIRDGAAGTVLWRGKLQTGALPPTSIPFPSPLKGTAATLLEIVALTAVTGGIYANLQGYSAP